MGRHVVSSLVRSRGVSAPGGAARIRAGWPTVTSRSVLVVGAGIGGITAATHLANAGMHVTVLEKD